MKPETVQKLQATVPELRELIAFLASEAEKLNTLDGLAGLPAADRQEALAGKLWAHKTITAMLAPLIAPVEATAGVDPSEYVV